MGDVSGGAKVAQFMRQGSSRAPSEQTVLEELVRVGRTEPATVVTICPICKMEISSAGCPACSR